MPSQKSRGESVYSQKDLTTSRVSAAASCCRLLGQRRGDCALDRERLLLLLLPERLLHGFLVLLLLERQPLFHLLLEGLHARLLHGLEPFLQRLRVLGVACLGVVDQRP